MPTDEPGAEWTSLTIESVLESVSDLSVAAVPPSLEDGCEQKVLLLESAWRLATYREDLGDLNVFQRGPASHLSQDPSSSPDKKGAPEEFVAPHGSFGGFFETHFSGRPWEEAVWDGYLTQPAVLIPIFLLAGAGAVFHWDGSVSQQWQGALGSNATYGDVGMGVLVAAPVILGVLFPGPDRNTWDELWTQAEAFGLTTGITEILKISVGRVRPNGLGGSFPSGHVSAAFAGATLLERNFGELAAIPAYAVATLVAYSRIESGWHFPSDVLAAAAIGILSTRIIDDLHWGQGGIAKPHVDVKIGVAGGRGFEVELAFGF
jgi:membrane-associated phospholipid phosphatase